MVDANVEIIKELQLFLRTVSDDTSLRSLFSTGSGSLSRQRKLRFEKLVSLLINMLKRSLSIEIQSFFKLAGYNGITYTKGAFSMQRTKLNPVFFDLWNRVLVDSFYTHYGNKARRWRGFRLLAVDGSTAYLPDKGDIKEFFGSQDNQYVQIPMARIIQVHDVLNDLTIYSRMDSFHQSEQNLIAANIHHLPTDSVSLYDRGYPSYTLLYLLLNEESPRHFVMRCKRTFNKVVESFVLSGKCSKIVEFTPNQKAIDQLYAYGYKVTRQTPVRVRLVKVKLPNGEVEILITSLYNEQIYSVEDLKSLYALRWRIETAYNKHKNQQQMEVFSGHKAICILQDYTAGIFTANLQSLITKQTEQYLYNVNSKRQLAYQVNRNVSWAALKDNIVRLFLQNDILSILASLEDNFKKYLEPIRPGRKYDRKHKIRRLNGKYLTYPNYKRAI